MTDVSWTLGQYLREAQLVINEQRQTIRSLRYELTIQGLQGIGKGKRKASSSDAATGGGKKTKTVLSPPPAFANVELVQEMKRAATEYSLTHRPWISSDLLVSRSHRPDIDPYDPAQRYPVGLGMPRETLLELREKASQDAIWADLHDSISPQLRPFISNAWFAREVSVMS